MRIWLTLVLVFTVAFESIAQDIRSDSTILLNPVTIVDGEDPAVVLLRELKAAYIDYRKIQPQNITYYSRQISDSIRTDFEQLATVSFSDGASFQSVEAFKDYSKKPADFGNSVSVGFEIDLSPGTDFNSGQSKGTFGQYPLSDYRSIAWTPLAKSEFSPYHLMPVPGWLVQGGWTNYRVELVKSMLFQGEEFVTLALQPKEGRVGWSGTLEVNATTKRVLALRAVYDGVTVSQQFTSGGTFYPSEIKMEVADPKFSFEYKVTAVNTPTPANTKRNPRMVAYLPEPTELQEDFWTAYRPKSEVLDEWTRKQDSLIRYLNSDAYLDSADAEYNKFHWYEPLVSGMGYRKRSKGTNVFISPLIAQWNAVGIGGVRWMPSILFSKRFSNYQSISTVANVNYGFLNQDLKGSVSTTYTYAPLHNGSIRFSAGDEYKQITQSVDIAGIFARSNFVRKIFAEGYHRYEWMNGFYTEIGLEYSNRESIQGLQFAEWTNDLFGQRNEPAPFPSYTVAQLGVEMLIRPYQRYYLKGRQKIVLSSKWPDFIFSFKQGIPNLFGSDVSYSKYEMLVEDMLRFGPLGESFYRFSSGGFLNDPDQVRFIEYKWFRGGDYFLFTQPLYTYQALPETFASPSVYLTGSAIHHFDGFFLGKIPVIRRLKLGTALGASFLAVPNENVAYLESYVGLERKVRLWDTPTRFGVYYLLQPEMAQQGFRIKIGVDVKDTFNDRWNF